jgi:Calcineurin-like phosphoesterase superfamily domain
VIPHSVRIVASRCAGPPRQLHTEHQRLLEGWPPTCRVEISGLGDILFCHATPRNDTEIFTTLTPEDPAVVCGHTHMQFDRIIGTTRSVNAGSVGMPFGEPGTDWLLLGPDVQFQHTHYDLARAADQIRSTAYPQAEAFCRTQCPAPPRRRKHSQRSRALT